MSREIRRDRAVVIAIAGPPGSGKTTWIAQQAIASGDRGVSEPALYWPLGGAGVSLDALFLASRCPNLEILTPGDSALAAALAQNRTLYVEIDNSVDLAQLQFPAGVDLETLGLLPEGWQSKDLEAWSDRLLPSPVPFPRTPFATEPQICAVELTGQVFDPPSLDVFWQELTGGAFGTVHRAKGGFCLADGPAFYFSFVAGTQSTYTRLQVEPCLQGRPQLPSALEATGHELNGEAILATLKDCLLSDGLLQQHQAQLQAIAS